MIIGTRIVFLRDLPDQDRLDVEKDLEALRVAPHQLDFSLPAPMVLDAGRKDPSRDTFAILAKLDRAEVTVGIGALQPIPSSSAADACTEVLLRGFSLDPAWQCLGIGSRAARLAVDAAGVRFPRATSVSLGVHIDNLAGVRAYLRAGFAFTGETEEGRAGTLRIMRAPV